MKLTVRRVSPLDQRQELLDLLQRNLGVSQDRVFNWQYTMNPAGSPWCWFAYANNTPVAMASLFPRSMYVDGRAAKCGQVTHFVIDVAYRSLGPALQLQTATFGPVDSGELSFCYDCPPHDRGMSTFQRLGMNSSCAVTRYALPLRSDEYFDKRFGRRSWTKPLAAATNIALKIRTRFRSVPGIEIVEHAGDFGEEFTSLDERVTSSGRIRASRSAEDLRWRYKQDPGSATRGNGDAEYRVLLARRRGELQGFLVLVLNRAEVTAHILDLFGVDILLIGPALLESAVALCRQGGLYSLYGFCSERTEMESLFRNSGFRPREKVARIVAYESQQKQTPKFLKSDLRWPFGQFEVRL